MCPRGLQGTSQAPVTQVGSAAGQAGTDGYLELLMDVLGSDLMREHLREIRSLRQRLEDSISTNDGLRQQLEERLACSATEKGNTHTHVNMLAPPC